MRGSETVASEEKRGKKLYFLYVTILDRLELLQYVKKEKAPPQM